MVQRPAPGQTAHQNVNSTVLVCISVPSINTMMESNLKRKGFISSYRLNSIIKGSQGMNSRQKFEAETMVEMLLPGLLGFPSSKVQAYLIRVDAIYSGLGLPTSVINQDNSPHTSPQGNLTKATLQLRFPLFR